MSFPLAILVQCWELCLIQYLADIQLDKFIFYYSNHNCRMKPKTKMTHPGNGIRVYCIKLSLGFDTSG